MGELYRAKSWQWRSCFTVAGGDSEDAESLRVIFCSLDSCALKSLSFVL